MAFSARTNGAKVMLISLSLKNFRKHRELKLEFTEGLNLLTGGNWRGKTSALSAIPFALFGTRATHGTAADLPTFGTTDMRVNLEFAVGDETYHVVRTVKSATLSRGMATLATGHAPVTAEVEKLLGTSLKDFTEFQVTAQGEADSLLSASSAKMSDYVDRVLGTDVIDRALERIKEELQGAKGALAMLPEGPVPLAELQGQLDAAETGYREAEAEKVVAEAEARSTAAAREEASNKASELKAGAEASSVARRKLEAAQASLESAQRKLEQALAEAPAEEPADPEPVRAMVAALQAQAELRAKQEISLTELTTALGNADAALVEMPETGGVQTDLHPLLGRREELDQLAQECGRRHLMAKGAVDNAACPYCKRPFDDADLGAVYAELDLAVEALESALADRDRVDAELRVTIEANEKIQAVDVNRGAWANYRDTVLAELTKLQSELVEPVDWVELENLRAELSLRDAETAKYRKAEQEAESATRWVEQAISAMADCPVPSGPTLEEVELAQQAAARASEEALKAVHRWELATRASVAAKALLSPLRAAVEAETTRLERWQHFTTRTAALQELGKFLRSNRDRFTSEFWTQLLGYASTLIQEATSGGVTRLFRSPSGDFMYEEDGREIAVEGSASGMQRAIFGTAIKLSLAAAIGNPFPVMLFDEVTAAAQDEVSLQFTSLLASAGKQVIMVTHRGADAAAADNLLVI